ncbi:MAG: phage major tail tube protein [Rickettsia endosymbiont of Ixodes persulcatus]|nr:phage major tail tube protein [Rickettsia endosymbiont of Ixodes persulcatus]
MIKVPHTLKNFNLFIAKAGASQESFAGLITELTLPKLSIKTEEFRAGGMDAPIPIEVGMESLNCDFSLAEYNEATLELFGFFDYETSLTFLGAFDDGTALKPTAVKLNGVIKETDFGSWKMGSLVTLKASFVATYYQLTIGGKEKIEIDIRNMVRKINGTDQLGGWKSAILGG